jgi:hypothetical protein
VAVECTDDGAFRAFTEAEVREHAARREVPIARLATAETVAENLDEVYDRTRRLWG